MRIRFKKNDLLPATAIVQSVANPQTTLPILSNVLISADGDSGVSFSATDYETRVKIEVPGSVEKKGSITIPARTLYDLVKELPEDDDVIVEYKDKSVNLRCRDILCELQTMPAKDFPKWPEMQGGASFDIDQQKMKFILDKVLFAIPNRDPRKVLLGSLFELNPGSVAAIATDGKVLAYVKAPVEDLKVKNQSIVVPYKILEELSRNLGADEPLNVSFDDKQIAFRLRNVLFVSNQIEGKYPNYDAVVPKSFDKNFQFQKPAMLSAIRRASVLTDIKNTAVTLAFNEGRVTVEAESYDKGRIHEEFPAANAEGPFKMVFNYKFLNEVMKAIDKDEVVLQANQPATPAVFKGVDSNDNFYLVMPIKITELRDYEDEGRVSASPEDTNERNEELG